MQSTNKFNAKLSSGDLILRNEILDKGYTVIPGGVDKIYVDQFVADFKKLKNRAVKFVEPSCAGMYRRIVNLQSTLTSAANLFAFNKAVPILDSLFDAESVLYTSLFFEIGSEQELHRDTPYFWTNPPYKYFGVWVALEDIDGENGCLEVVPYSHKVPEENRAELYKKFYSDPADVLQFDMKMWNYYQTEVMANSAKLGFHKIEVPVKKGDVIVWHPQTLHGGKCIIDQNRSRLSVAMHVTPINTAVYHNNAFFNPGFEMVASSKYNYILSNGRNVAVYDTVSFEHACDIAVTDPMWRE